MNSVVTHPYWPLAITAGVERHILAHVPSMNAPNMYNIPRTSTETRALPAENHSLGGLLLVSPRIESIEGHEDLNLALFDESVSSPCSWCEPELIQGSGSSGGKAIWTYFRMRGIYIGRPIRQVLRTP